MIGKFESFGKLVAYLVFDEEKWPLSEGRNESTSSTPDGENGHVAAEEKQDQDSLASHLTSLKSKRRITFTFYLRSKSQKEK